MKHYNHLLILLFSLMGLSTFAQTSKKTLNYQAVILDPKAIDIPGASIVGQPLNKGNVCLRFSLLNAQGGLDYEETQQVVTDEYGLVNVAIGAGAQAQAGNSTSIYKSFDSVLWNSSVKSLKVSVSYDGCNSFKQVSAQALNYTPYALYAEAVDYKNVREAPTKLSQFSNDAGYLIPKDLDPLKSDIQTNSSKIEVANKSIADNKQASDAAFLVVNQSITSLDTQVATANQTIADNKKSSDATFLIVNQSITSLDTKVAENASSIITINTKLTDQQNQISDNRNQISATNNNLNNQIGGLQGQINNTNSTVSSLTGTAEVVSNKSVATNLGGANPSDQLYPSQKAAKSYIDNAIYDAVGSGVPDATTLAAGKVKLAGDLGGTAANPTVPALAGKENSSNKTTAIDLGAGNPSDLLYPSQKATKAYIDNSIYAAVGSGVPDATTNAAGKLKLSGDLGGTAASPTVPGLLLKADIISPTFTGTPKAPTPASSDNSTQIATTAFVQAATSGIALQASVDAKADKNSPTFTGTPSLPTGTTGVTQTLGDNSTKLATTKYVDAQVAAGAPEASTASKGIIQLTNELGGTASLPTVPGLAFKENLANKSTAADLGASLASDDKYPTQNAVKVYVDTKVASATIADANSTTRGKIQLAGDLAGTNSSASAPVISNGAINSAKIEDRSIATDDIADLAITDGKIAGIAGAKVTGNITGNAANVTGTIAVGKGGTGATELTGYVKGNGTNAMTTVSSIPVSDVTGAVTKVNGTLPNSTGEVSILFGRVTSGNYASVPTSGGVNGDIYIVSGELVNTSNNGRTFIKDDAAWNEVSPNTAATDARYLQLAGGIMDGTLSFPTGKTLILTDAPSASTDAANKAYVDGKITTEVPNASTTVIGKIKLAGDLSGTYDAPTVPGLGLKAPIENPSFTGTVSGITKSMVGLGNLDNTSDANKPVSDATITALSYKAPIASPSFTGTVSGITKAMVDLANVDNTSDANKPISTATASSLSAKENSNNKSTATDLGASIASDDKFPTQKAVKTYVDASVLSGAPDADGTTRGKIQLAGDLGGTNSSASAPVISNSAISTAKLAADAVTSAKILDGEIVNADISTNAVIVDTKLGTIATAGKVSNSATTAASANTASAIVARDASGDFSAGKITATEFLGPLFGNATTATSATTAISFSGNLLGDVTGGQGSTVVAKINGVSLKDLSSGLLKNTTTTGVPSIATAGSDYSAGTSALTTGILKSTTSTGALSIASASDFPTLNQNTTGNAATATKLVTSKTINGTDFDGSANITVIADAGTLSGTTLKSTVVSSSLTSVGTLSDLTVTNAISGSVTGTAANVTGTVAVGNGGTGAITLTSGSLLKGNGTSAISAATAGTDYQAPITLTTTGTGAATLTSNTLNIPAVSSTVNAGSISGTVAVGNGGTGAITLTSGSLLKGNGTSAISAATAGTDYSVGTSLLGTGILKSTASTGALTIASASDFPTLNQNTTGNAATATKLAATKTINGTAFDGSSDITVTADAGTLSGTTLKSTVVSSSLTSVGTLTDLTVTNDLTVNGLTIGRGAGSPNNAENTALGIGTLKVNSAAGTSTQGVSNTAVGFNSLIANTFGSSLTALGHSSLLKNITGSNNVALGQAAMYNNTGGSNNVAIGNASLYTNTTSFGNTAIGKSAGQYLNNENNTVIGAYSDLNDPTFKNATAIGYGARVRASNTIQLGADGATLNTGAITTTAITNVRTSGTLTLGLVTYPNSHGTSGQILSTTGTGDLSWITPSTSATSFSGSLTGDVTGTQSTTVVGKINGVSLSGLNTGLLKNTTTTGVPSIATAGSDYSAGTSALTTGILKSTTTTGALTIAAASDFPTLNQNTTGNASTATTAGNITATSNSTLTSISNLSAVGTITTGTWSATAIGTSKGGTGLTSFTSGGAVYASSTSVLTTGTLPVASGGTGATTTANALINLGASPAAGSSVIATVGTIGAGTWNGTLIGGTYGGTGVNNGAKTITLGGNLSTAGEFATTLTSTGTTNVTLPTSGTLATLGGAETLSNKALTQISSVGFKGASSGTATLAAPAVAGITTITLPGANGTLATLAGTETLTNKTLTSPYASSVIFNGSTNGTATLLAPSVAGTGTTITLPGANGTLATLAGTETLTNKTLTSPTFSGTVSIPTASVTGTITAKNYVAPTPTSTTAAATTSIDFSTGNIFKINLGTNITTLTITNPAPGTFLLEIIQGGTYTVTFPTGWKWSGGTAPTITATNTKTDIITIVYDGTTYFASAVQNF